MDEDHIAQKNHVKAGSNEDNKILGNGRIAVAVTSDVVRNDVNIAVECIAVAVMSNMSSDDHTTV